MKKRINSAAKFEYAVPATIQIDLQPEKKIQANKNLSRCPLPKPSKKQHRPHQKHRQSSKCKLKQFQAPILNELRHLIKNIVDSSNRLSSYVDKELHSCTLQLFFQDRQKLIQFVNSLVVKQVSIQKVQKSLQKYQTKDKLNQIVGCCHGIEENDNILHQLRQLRRVVDCSISKKRSKSDIQGMIQKDIKDVKSKVGELQKNYYALGKDLNLSQQNKAQQANTISSLLKKLNDLSPKQHYNILSNPENTQDLTKSQEIENIYEKSPLKGIELTQIQAKLGQVERQKKGLIEKINALNSQIVKLKNAFMYIEILIFKSEQILSEHLRFPDQAYFDIHKQRIEVLQTTLKDALVYVKYQNDIFSSESLVYKLKEEAQALVIYVTELNKQSLKLGRQKQQLVANLEQQKENTAKEERYYEQLKTTVNKLNDEMSQLIHEVDKKDELVEYLKLQNQNLKDDIANLQEMIRNIKSNDKQLSFQLSEMEEKLRVQEMLTEAKQDHIRQLIRQVQNKNAQISSKQFQLQTKEEDIAYLKDQNHKNIQELDRARSRLAQLTKYYSLQQVKLSNDLKERQSKLKFMEQESDIIEKKIENAYELEEKYKFTIQTLEEKIQFLERQNQQLYKDVKSHQLNHQNSQQQVFQSLLILKSQHEATKRQNQDYLKKLIFYEGKFEQIVQLTNTSQLQKTIEDKQQIIRQLQQKLNQHLGSKKAQITLDGVQTMVIKQEPQGQSDIVHTQNQTVILSNSNTKSEEYVPFLEQYHHLDHGTQDMQRIHIGDQLQPSGVSAMSHYQINVINQNLDKIQSQNAIHNKGHTKVDQIHSNILSCGDDLIKQQEYQCQFYNLNKRCKSNMSNISNLADAYDSDHEQSQPNKSLICKSEFPEKRQEFKNCSLDQNRISKISKNINIDNEIEKKVDRIEKFEKKLGKTCKSDTSQQKVEIEQVEAQQNQVHEQVEVQPDSLDGKEEKSLKARNIYIMINKNNKNGTQLKSRFHRSQSCYDQKL